MPDESPVARICFDAFVLDLQGGEILKDGRSVKLAPQPFSVLAFLASRSGRIVTREEIQGAIWGEGTFVDFELGLNQCIRQIRTALDDDARDPRYVETLSRRGYRFKAPVRQESDAPPPAIPAAPPPAHIEPPQTGVALHLPERPPAASFPSDDGGARPSSGGFNLRSPGFLLLGACAAVLLAVVAISLRHGAFSNLLRSHPQTIRSLAVLPFRNLSGDPAQEYFAEGMTDQLITRLAQIPTLRVISRTSVMRYRDTKESLPEIASNLKVDAVVEGSVMRSGDRVRITAQLVRAQHEKHLWAKSYDRNLGDVLSLQGEIAEEIATEIRVKLTPQAITRLKARRSENPAAEDSYLKGEYYFRKSQSEWDESAEAPLEKSISYFQRAVRIDPKFSIAYSALAMAYDVTMTSDVRDASHNPAAISEKAKAAAVKAIDIDQSNPAAHLALAWDRFAYDWDWAGAASEFQRALSLRPAYATGRYWYAMYLTAMGRSNQAIAQIRAAEALDMASPVSRLGSAWVFYQARRYDDAIQADRATIALNPSSARAHYALGWVSIKRGLFQQAAAEFQTASNLSSDGNSQTRSAYTAYLDAVSGKRNAALHIVRKLEANHRPLAISPYVMAEIYAALKQNNPAFAKLDEAYRQRQFGIIYLKVDPDLDDLRSDPRFAVLLHRMDLAE